MRRSRAAFAGTIAIVLAGCSLLTNLDGYSGGAGGDGGGPRADVLAAEGSTDGQACAPDASVDPTLLSDAIDVAVGNAFACAIRANGTVVCWGDNTDQKLGGPGPDRSTPAAVSGLSRITAITAGTNFACALDADKHVWCWGGNANGEVGAGAVDAVPHLPALVRGPGGAALEGATAIRAGGSHACAIANGKVICWGSNGSGQLGRTAAGPVAANVDGVANAIELATSGDYTCAVADDPGGSQPKAIFCWGNNDQLQLGRAGGNSSVPQRIALRIAAAGDLPILAGGYAHVCARDEANALWCWGENDFGQLGDALSPGPPNATLQQMKLGAVRMAAAGDDFTCAVRSDSTVACLGANFASELGNGTIDPAPDGAPSSFVAHMTPGPVTGLGAVDRVAAFWQNACAILAHPCPATGGPLVCWGANGSGQLGGGNTSPISTFVRVRAP